MGKMKHVMIDIETMASSRDAAVISIGLAEFIPETCTIARVLEVRNTLEVQMDLGRRFDPGTMEWWLRQSPAAQKQLLNAPRFTNAAAMMTKVYEFLHEISSSQWDLGLWAKGPSFDLVICRDLAEQVKVKWKGHYSREYCVRTILALAKSYGWDDILAMAPEVAHGALSDAVHQANQVMAVMKRLRQ